jgi:DNA-binding MarR family transcriptional regulator
MTQNTSFIDVDFSQNGNVYSVGNPSAPFNQRTNTKDNSPLNLLGYNSSKVLALLLNSKRGLTVTDITKHTGTTRQAVDRITFNLSAKGYLVKDKGFCILTKIGIEEAEHLRALFNGEIK